MSVAYPRPLPDSFTIDETSPNLEPQHHLVTSLDPMEEKYLHNKVDDMNPPIPISRSNGKLHEPIVWFSDSLPTVSENSNKDDFDSIGPFFFDNTRRKVYSCRSLDLDSDFDLQRMKPPRDVRSVEYKGEASIGSDGVDRLFVEKEIKNPSKSSLNDNSSWSLWNTDSAVIRDPLSVEVKVSIKSSTCISRHRLYHISLSSFYLNVRKPWN